MRDVVRSLQGEAGQPTPLDQAHEILLRAYQEPDEQRRVQVGRYTQINIVTAQVILGRKESALPASAKMKS